MARFGHIFLTLFLIAALAAFAGTAWLLREVSASGPLAAEKLIYIEPGRSIRSIAAQLLEAGVIKNDLAFIIDARLQNRAKELKAGEYLMPAGISIGGAITLLQSGRTYQHKITIPEGLMVTEIINLLRQEPVLAGDIVDSPAEGSLLPETYKFSFHDTRSSIVERMKASMAAEIAAQWTKRTSDLPFKTPEEAVTLASIVEKETGLAAERPRVAGVFINRLRKGIPLQSDPTVIYAVTEGREKLDRELTYKDLKKASPYNTYTVRGLPPAPIANPGKASLAAVLNPEKNDFIYFVADGTGGHVFSRTLQEHNSNVARWRMLENKAR